MINQALFYVLVLRRVKNMAEAGEFMSKQSRLTNAVTRAPSGLIAALGVIGVLLAMDAGRVCQSVADIWIRSGAGAMGARQPVNA